MKYAAHPLVVAVALGLLDREALSTLDEGEVPTAEAGEAVAPEADVAEEDVDGFETVYLGS